MDMRRLTTAVPCQEGRGFTGRNCSIISVGLVRGLFSGSQRDSSTFLEEGQVRCHRLASGNVMHRCSTDSDRSEDKRKQKSSQA